jgi:hemerythrin
MLEHFHREEELMKSLPRNGPARPHCVAHRKEHVSFSTRYNLAVARIDARTPVTGIRDLDTLLTDWVRSHILEFDQRLAELLKLHA